MHKFTTILWDVDNTLLDFTYSQRHALAKCFRSTGREITEKEIALYTRINDDYWRRLELGEITREQLLNGQRNKLEISGLAEIMDGIFISEEIGSPKPHRQFFEYCLAHLEEKDKPKILIVGDSLSSDIKGGLQAGIAACWYHRGITPGEMQYIPDYTISDLHMIYDIIGADLPPL